MAQRQEKERQQSRERKVNREQLPALMSVTQAAKAIGITRQGLWSAISRGYVETVKSGPYTLVPKHAVQKYAAQERKPGPKTKKKS